MSSTGPRAVPCLVRLIRTAAAGVAVTLLVAAGEAGPSLAQGTAPAEQGMQTGAPLAEPATATGTGTAEGITLSLDPTRARVTVGGRDVWGESYAHAYLGPTLRLQPGTTTAITLHNDLPVATNLHFHGLHVSPEGAADDPFACVPPGAAVTYRLTVPADHQQGTFWYHSHAMGTTCPRTSPGGTAGHSMSGFVPGDVENQVFAGLSGLLTVGDAHAGLPPALQRVPVRELALKDVQVDAGGRIVQNHGRQSIDSNAPTARLVDGQLRPVLSMRPGETQLWRLANVGADIFYRLKLDGSRFTVLAEDGQRYPAATYADDLLIPPGKRYDVLVTAGTSPGSGWLRTLAYSNGPQGDSYPDTPLVRIDVPQADPAPATPTAGLDHLTGAPADLSSATIARSRTVTLSEDATGTAFYVNGRQFEMGHPSFADPARLGTVEEWTVRNSTGEDHPFHVHTNAFQVMSVDGTPTATMHSQDTVVVPHAVNGVPGTVTLRLAFSDHPGRWMFHCHIAAHEDHGMMGYVHVVP